MENSQIESTISEIRKRSGAVTSFNKDKISNAIYKALETASKTNSDLADSPAEKIVDKINLRGMEY